VAEETLRVRAQRLARRLHEHGVDAEAVDSVAVVGGGAAPGVGLASAAVSLPASLAEPLRTGLSPVVGRVENDRCLLDLRTVEPADDDVIAEAVRACRDAPQ
jgi:L-seryl-tRNA(Ser) seleniumtransferase